MPGIQNNIRFYRCVYSIDYYFFYYFFYYHRASTALSLIVEFYQLLVCGRNVLKNIHSIMRETDLCGRP